MHALSVSRSPLVEAGDARFASAGNADAGAANAQCLLYGNWQKFMYCAQKEKRKTVKLPKFRRVLHFMHVRYMPPQFSASTGTGIIIAGYILCLNFIAILPKLGLE
jgi:hypothetical protein